MFYFKQSKDRHLQSYDIKSSTSDVDQLALSTIQSIDITDLLASEARHYYLKFSV